MKVMLKRPSEAPVMIDTEKDTFLIRSEIGIATIKTPFGDDIVLLTGINHNGFGKLNFRFAQNEDAVVYGTALFLSRSKYVDAEFESLSIEQQRIIKECFPAGIYSDLDKHEMQRKNTEMQKALSTAYIESRVKDACMHSGSFAGALIGADELSAILFPPSEMEDDESEAKDEPEDVVISTYAESKEEDVTDVQVDVPPTETALSYMEETATEGEPEEPLIKPDTQEVEDIRRQKEDADDLFEKSLRSLDDLLERHVQASTEENRQTLSFGQYYKIIIDGRALLDEYLAETSNQSMTEDVGLRIREIILEKYIERVREDTAFFDEIWAFVGSLHTESEKASFLYHVTRELIGSMDLKAEYAKRHAE